MFAPITRVAPVVSKVASRQMSVISTPPRNKVSFAEMCALGLTVAIGVTAYPAWVLTHIKEYKGKGDE